VTAFPAAGASGPLLSGPPETGPVATAAVDRDAAGAPALRWSPDPLLGPPYEQAPLGPATLVRGPGTAPGTAEPTSREQVPVLAAGADAAAQEAALARHGAVLVPLVAPTRRG
jgi:hypothetical protein